MRRIMIAGTNSGCGKTTVTCAVLQALVNRKINVEVQLQRELQELCALIRNEVSVHMPS